MLSLFSTLSDPQFMPHGHCYFWQPGVLWLNVISDASIALACFSIPVALFYYVKRRGDVQFNWIFKLFATFIFACGTTHLMEIWNVWHGNYVEAGFVKLVTGAVSTVTAILLWPLIPRALKIPSIRQLEDLNNKLQHEIDERCVAQERLTALNSELEMRVAQATQEFRQLADSMPQIVWAAGPDGQFDYHNRRWDEFNNRESGASKEDGSSSTFHPEDAARCLQAWQTAIASGSPYEAEGRILNQQTGEFRWHLARALPIRDSQGKIIRWYGTSTDVHERKKLEDERAKALANEQAARGEVEHASRLKDEFLATLSHELRTPLNAILGWVQLIRRGISSPEKTLAAMETVEKNARMQAQIIEDLLDMNRIISGKVNLQIQEIDPATVVNAALDTVFPASQAKRLVIHKEIEKNISGFHGDPHRLQQVVWNLLSNAVKFSEQGGSIFVTLGKVNELVVITIRDNGLGIEPGFLPHIFERFRQADSSMTRRHGGLGLGLSIVKNLVEIFGGTVEARSAGLRAGSEFIVSLPLISAVDIGITGTPNEFSIEDGLTTSPLSRDLLKGLSILVVDDELDARELVREIFSMHGALVTLAANAPEALTLLKTQPFDLLVSDIGMPGMDGFEFMRKIREERQQQNGQVPAIALTAFARNEDRLQALKSGYQKHLTKPLEPNRLVATAFSLVSK